MERFRRVEWATHTPGLSVPCAACGTMLAYDRAWIGAAPFRFYHETCARQIEAEAAQ